MQTRPIIQFNNIFRLGFRRDVIDNAIPSEFGLLAIPETETESIADKIAKILLSSDKKLIELIIIPDRYMADLEVLKTIQAREVAHQKKHGIGIVLTATDANRLLEAYAIPLEVRKKVYKISTIRHGFEVEKIDENQNLMINFAKICVADPGSILMEIVIRACHSAGYRDHGHLYPETYEPIGGVSLLQQTDEAAEANSRAFLHGEIGEKGTPEYKQLKQLSIRTQTASVKNVTLSDPSFTNPLYSMRESLNKHAELRHLSVKAYYCYVNPVPERNPVRMGLWRQYNRLAHLTYPKAVRLISPDCDEGGDKPNHLTRFF